MPNLITPAGRLWIFVLLVMLCSACKSDPFDEYSGALKNFARLLEERDFEIVVPPRSDRAPGCVLDNDTTSAVVRANIPVVTAPPAPAAFIKSWTDTDHMEAGLDLFSLLPAGERLRAAFSSQGVRTYTMTLSDAYILATTLDDVELGLYSLAPDRRASARRGTRVIVESLFINEVTIAGDWSHQSAVTIDVESLAAATKGELGIKRSGEGAFSVSVQSPVAVAIRTRPLPQPEQSDLDGIELDYERSTVRFEVAVQSVSKEVTYCTKVVPYAVVNDARMNLTDAAFDLQSSQTEGAQLPVWSLLLPLGDVRSGQRITFRVDAHEETHCNPSNFRGMEAVPFGAIAFDAKDVVTTWTNACRDLPRNRWQDNIELSAETFRCELFFSETNTASKEKSRAWAAGRITYTLVPRFRQVRTVHVPAKGDLGALVYGDMRYWDRAAQSKRKAPASDAKLIASALNSVGRLRIPKGMDAYLIGCQFSRWQDSLTAGIDKHLRTNSLPLDLSTVCKNYQALRTKPLEWRLYLRSFWHSQLVAIDLAEDDLSAIPRFETESGRLTGLLMEWASGCLAPVLDKLIAANDGYVIMIGPSFFETTDCSFLNTMVWPKLLLAQNRSLQQLYPPVELSLDGGRMSTVPSQYWPDPNAPSVSMLWARVLQAEDMNESVVSECTVLGKTGEASKIVGLSNADSTIVFGMNDPIPRDNGDGFARLFFELRVK